MRYISKNIRAKLRDLTLRNKQGKAPHPQSLAQQCLAQAHSKILLLSAPYFEHLKRI
jgi:hypothetical protein